MTLVTVREHAKLTAGPVMTASLDEASIPPSAFEWLCREAQRYRAGGAELVQVEGRSWLRVDNYVGVLESPCGTRIEILPKHVRCKTDVITARKVLVQMLRHGLHLPVRNSGPTTLQTFHAPISEWIIQQFLSELNRLIRGGLRFDYRLVAEEVRFLRGRLQVARQIRQPLGRQHLLQVEHQIFDANRAENRLIASALFKVARMTHEPGNWRLAHELEQQLTEIPCSEDVPGDFRRWSCDRLMSHYSGIRAWCQLILSDRNPLSTVGEWTGRSLLFPMERVFERYVEVCLRRKLPQGAKLRTQAAGRSLCRQSGRPMFQLRPDFLIEHEGLIEVIDAKWKLLDPGDVASNYGLSQSDFYQLFAYGQRYLGGQGRMTLVYPGSDVFNRSLEAFEFGEGLTLEVVPLDLMSGSWERIPP